VSRSAINIVSAHLLKHNRWTDYETAKVYLPRRLLLKLLDEVIEYCIVKEKPLDVHIKHIEDGAVFTFHGFGVYYRKKK